MHLATDYIHPTPRGGKCRVRVWLPEDEQDAPVVVCTELPTNEGSSITYAAEQLAAEVIRYPRLPTPVVWIEHHPPLATDGTPRGRLGAPLVLDMGIDTEQDGLVRGRKVT